MASSAGAAIVAATAARRDGTRRGGGPLRESLDWLRDEMASLFQSRGASLFKDVWAARDAYIDLILERSAENESRFFAAHALQALNVERRSEALDMLEAQRQAMLMYASCAWFFDDIGGIETVQALKHAARAIQLAEALGGPALEEGFMAKLAAAKSNLPDPADGMAVYGRYALPVRIDFPRLAAHYAVSTLFHDVEDETRIGNFAVFRDELRLLESGRSTLAMGRLRAASAISHKEESYCFAVLHLRDQNVSGGVMASSDIEAFEKMADELEAVLGQGDLTEVVAAIARHFPGEPISIRSLFRDEQRQVIRNILEPVLEEAEDVYRHIYEEHSTLMRFLAAIDYPLPNRLLNAAEIALDLELGRALEQDDVDAAQVRMLLDAAKAGGITFEAGRLSLVMQHTLERLAQQLSDRPEDEAALGRLADAVEVLDILPFEVDIWHVQTTFYRVQEIAPLKLKQRLLHLGETLKVRVRLD